MVLKRSTLFLILIGVAISVSLFVVKYRVQNLSDELTRLDHDIRLTEENIHVLKAEWSHLNRPDRLRRLAGEYLAVGPLDAERVGSADRILDALPARPNENVAKGDGQESKPADMASPRSEGTQP